MLAKTLEHWNTVTVRLHTCCSASFSFVLGFCLHSEFRSDELILSMVCSRPPDGAGAADVIDQQAVCLTLVVDGSLMYNFGGI